MAVVILDYQSPVYIPVAQGCCAEVFLCLAPDWVSKTVSGSQLVVATIENAGRQLLGPMNPTHNVRCTKVYQYVVKINLNQFLTDLAGIPYTPDCSDINEIMPYACTVQSILDIVEAGNTLSQLCLVAQTAFPANPSTGCIVNIVGAQGGDPADGLYYYNGNDWVQLGLF